MPSDTMRSQSHFGISCRYPKFQAFKIQMFGRIKNFFGRQVFRKPKKQGVAMDASAFGPLGNGQRFAVMRKSNVAKPIVGLLFARCPTTVFGTVRAIVVNALKSHAWRPFAHIGNKVCKIQPSVANSNAAPAITVVMRCASVKAPLLDVLPAHINRAARFAMEFVHGDTVLHRRGKVK